MARSVFLVLAVALVAGCASEAPAEETPVVSSQPPNVTVSPEALATLPVTENDFLGNLKLINAYAFRNDSSAAKLWDIVLVLGVSAGSPPIDLAEVRVRVADAPARVYEYSSKPLAMRAPASESFHVTWLRGYANDSFVGAGELVELHFNNAEFRGLGQIAIVPRDHHLISITFGRM